MRTTLKLLGQHGTRRELSGSKPSALIAQHSVLAFALCSLTEAQEPGKIYRIGFLYAGNPSAIAGRIKAFREGLIERGYIEGKNLVVETRYGEGKSERMPALAGELVRLKVDVI